MPGFEPRADAGITDVAPLGPSMTRTIAAIFDTVVPGDAEPGGWAGGGESSFELTGAPRLVSGADRSFLSTAVND
jgi:hypothetical protein